MYLVDFELGSDRKRAFVFVDVYEMAIIVKSNVVSKQEKVGILRPLMISLSLMLE